MPLQVLAFFAAQGMALRVRPPLLLVDGPTLEAEHGEDCDEDRGEDVAKGQTKSNGDETPVFHITGLCKSKSWGRVNHVVATHKGYSRLHKQPSLDATLRPADLSARNVEVRLVPKLACAATNAGFCWRARTAYDMHLVCLCCTIQALSPSLRPIHIALPK